MMKSELKEVFEQHNGILTAKEAKLHGFSAEALRKACLRGDVERSERGVYVLSVDFADDLFQLQQVFRRGIFSHQTAVMLHRLSTFSPFYYSMTFPHGYHSKSFEKRKVQPSFSTEKYYDVGVEEVETWFGNKVVAYNKERTIIDMLRSEDMLYWEEEIMSNYLNDPDKNITRLLDYARLFGQEEQLSEKGVFYA